MRVVQLFSPENMARRGLSYRAVQQQAAGCFEAALDAPLPPPRTVTLNDGNRAEIEQAAVGLIEAATGTGKTLAYLVPAFRKAAAGKRVAVSVFTRALLRQILDGRDLEAAADLAGHRPVVAPRLGRRNFVSRRSVLSLDRWIRESGKSTAEWRAMVDWVLGWDDATDPLDTTVSAWMEIGGALPRLADGREAPEDWLTLPPTADEDDARFFRKHAEQAAAADIVVTTHASLLLHPHLNILGEDRFDAVVIDEADRLPDAARAMRRRRLRLTILADRIRDPDVRRRAKAVAKEVAGVMAEIGELYGYEDIGLRKLALDSQLWRRLREAIARFDRFRAHLPDEDRIDYDVVRSVWLSDSEAGAPASTVGYLSFSPVRRLPSLAVEPLNVHRFLRRLFSGDNRVADRVAMTSATLGDVPVGDLGLNESQVSMRRSLEPVRFGHLSLTLADPRVPAPFTRDDDGESVAYDEDWLEYAASMIDHAAADGRVLALTPSYEESERLAVRLNVRRDDVWVHRAGVSVHDAVARIRRDRAIRVALTPAMWEGVDLRDGDGPWMRHIVITRAPLPPVSKALNEALVDEMLRRGIPEGKAQALLARRDAQVALRRLRQGIGRGIRAAGDRVQVWLADPRLTRAPASQDTNAVRELLCGEEGVCMWLFDRGDEETALAIIECVNASFAHPFYCMWPRALPSRFRNRIAAASVWLREGRPVFPAAWDEEGAHV